MQRIPFPGEPADDEARAIVAVQIGRPVRGEIAIAARCPYGLPGVVRTLPRLDDGTPFPTLFYLTCPVAVRDIGRLEADGTMTTLRDRLAGDEALAGDYAAAHERYRAMRDSLEREHDLEPLDEPMSAGGMPNRVKCLHALYAHEQADANPIGALVADRVEPLDCPGPCVADLGDGLEAVPGHPGFKSRRRRR